MPPKSTVKLDFSPGKRFAQALQRFERSGSGGGAFQLLRRRWPARYSSFARRRFKRLSSGGGEWAALAESTLKQRRGGKRRAKRGRRDPLSARTTTRGSAMRAAILRDTGILFASLSIGARGNLTKGIRGGVLFGFAGTRHPGGKFTIRQIAETQQEGNPAGNLPARPIIVMPDQATVRAMTNDIRALIDRKW